MPFSSSIDDRYFEDYVEGDVHRFGPIRVDTEEMIAFAKRFDPQPFHADPLKARQTVFGGIIASGWYTIGLMMRLYVDYYLTHVASLASPGVDEVRWYKPVRPEDALAVTVKIQKAVPSQSKPDRGIVTSLIEVSNQAGEKVMSLICVNIISRRSVKGIG